MRWKIQLIQIIKIIIIIILYFTDERKLFWLTDRLLPSLHLCRKRNACRNPCGASFPENHSFTTHYSHIWGWSSRLFSLTVRIGFRHYSGHTQYGIAHQVATVNAYSWARRLKKKKLGKSVSQNFYKTEKKATGAVSQRGTWRWRRTLSDGGTSPQTTL